ncbi:MAG TPA: 50S ribosomal protein L13 [bacterium]|nr:50S ribosomal protein L13 [bacterium]
MKTFMARKEDVRRKWYIIDADNKVLGRLATKVADTLRGKKKPDFTPHVDTGDFVIVVNAEKIRLTGNKAASKVYQSHSGYPGGFKEEKYSHMLAKHPERIIEYAVKGMIPKTKLGDKIIKKLKVYKGPEHPHKVQNPEVLK